MLGDLAEGSPGNDHTWSAGAGGTLVARPSDDRTAKGGEKGDGHPETPEPEATPKTTGFSRRSHDSDQSMYRTVRRRPIGPKAL